MVSQKKEENIMRRMFWIFLFVFGLIVSWTVVCAADFYVIPTKKKNYAPVEKTGQTTLYAAGDDGDLEKGVAWPDPRLTDNGDGTVTDNLTGLIWLTNANCFGEKSWSAALNDCNTLASGTCGLTDGSVAGDWRLSNIKEFQSLIDYGSTPFVLPSGHPFVNVGGWYWSSTTIETDSIYAYVGIMPFGCVTYCPKTNNYSVWPVRGGN
jgi:hypothetical protein